MNFCMYPTAFQKLTNSIVALEKTSDLSKEQSSFERLKIQWAIYLEQWQQNTKLQYVLA